MELQKVREKEEDYVGSWSKEERLRETRGWIQEVTGGAESVRRKR